MKKTIFALFGGLIFGAIVSPIAGMMIPQTRDMILFMAPDEVIFAQAEKLGKAFESEGERREIVYLEEIRDRQNAEIRNLKIELDKITCQKRKEDCAKKIFELEFGEIKLDRPGEWKGSRIEMIQKLQGLIAEWRKSQNSEPSRKADYQVSITNAQSDIRIIEDNMAKGEAEKKQLTLGECNNYKKACEEDSTSQ